MLAARSSDARASRPCCAVAVQRLPPPPTLPRPPAPVSFPVIAVVAPLAAAVVIGLLTGSPFVLVFAVLSPLVAIATVLDGRRVARRHRRLEAERFAGECAAFAAAIEQVHRAERVRADARYPILPRMTAGADDVPVRIGVAPAPSASAPDGPLLVGDGPEERRLLGLLDRARTHPALPLVVPRGALAVRGRGVAAANLARRLALEPGCTIVRLAADEPVLAGVVLIDLLTPLRVRVAGPAGQEVEGVPAFVARPECAVASSGTGPAEPPTNVRWSELHRGAAPGAQDAGGEPSAAVVIGHDGRQAIALDLVREGPHALVGGTTGSGKSEFLRTLALGWAARASPRELQLLLVDFKGGATFAGLVDLPHTIGLITDLDPVIAERTLLGLRAELQRRERLLVERGVRDAAEAPHLLPRLVVLVDEFAALIDAFPMLHAPFADLSARGRSLGVHLVLGTQHPAAVVRDAVAANCAVRVAFRLPDAAGSAFLGASGRGLGAAPVGRALIATSESERRVQVAVADDGDIAAVVDRWAGHPVAERPWQPPLPAVITQADARQRLAALEPDADLPAFGVLDDPAALRQAGARWDRAVDGPLVVIGSPGSGRSTALAAIAASSGLAPDRQVVLPFDLPAAWSLLDEVAAGERACELLVADDLDLLVAAAGELAPELLARWDAAVRAIRRGGGGAVASVGPATTSRPVLGARFPARVLLRALDAEDHALAGAPRGLFDRRAVPGRGWWLDQQVQIVADPPALRPAGVAAPPWRPLGDEPVAVVARRTDRVAAALADALPTRVVLRGAPETITALQPSAIHVAHPDDWQAAWAALSSHRRTCAVLVVGGEPSDLRTLLSVRATPPPIAPERGEAWLLEPGRGVERVRVDGLLLG
jgi:S-DNA-T family DNA segregation ATPase FtsK/SpoIIIE